MPNPSKSIPGLKTQHQLVPSLVNYHNYGKSPFFMGKLTISMAMFNSIGYGVKFPEGSWCISQLPPPPTRNVWSIPGERYVQEQPRWVPRPQ